MKAGRFVYHAPRELDEALALLREHGDGAKVLAGGQSLMPMLNFRLAAVDHIVDINRLGGLSEPRLDDGRITIPGGADRHNAASATFTTACEPAIFGQSSTIDD